MDEQLRPAQAHPHQNEIDALTEVANVVRKAIVEYQGQFPVAARLEICVAHRLLDRAYSGEAV